MNKNYFHEIVFSRLALSIFVIVMFILMALFKQPISDVINYSDIVPKLTLPNGKVIVVEMVDTQEQRIKGLSDRTSLSANKGMLFVFDNEGYHNFWMPDMNFAIDIIWLDKNYEIVDIAKNVQPMPNLELHELPSYVNKAPAMYVLEANAGFCDENKLIKGERLKLT